MKRQEGREEEFGGVMFVVKFEVKKVGCGVREECEVRAVYRLYVMQWWEELEAYELDVFPTDLEV